MKYLSEHFKMFFTQEIQNWFSSFREVVTSDLEAGDAAD
jgi:hypothetical protein